MAPLSRFASVLAGLIGGAGALGAGCSLVVDADGLAGLADAASSSEGATIIEGGPALDSGDQEATADATAADAPHVADTHAGPNLIADGAFEQGCSWGAYEGTATTDSTARTGTKSCRICTTPTTQDAFTGQDPFTAPPPVIGATYHAVAWVRTAPGAALPPGLSIHVRSSNPMPFQAIESDASAQPGLVVTDTWQKLEISLKTTMNAAEMDVFVGSATAPGACFLLDDVWLERLP